MKARLLKKLLNNTGYTVAFYDDYIGIGSPLCHDLIKVDIFPESFKITYALDAFRKGRKAINHPELEFIWDKLHELIGSHEIEDIINGNDELENPLPVYTVTRGKFISTFTDAYGWPNVTIEGHMMHDNDYFDNPKDALCYGIKEATYAEEWAIQSLNELNEMVEEKKKRIQEYQNNISELNHKLTQLNNK